MSRLTELVLIPGVLLSLSCAPAITPVSSAPSTVDLVTPQTAFWRQLQALCSSATRAAEGRLLKAPEGNTQVDPNARLVVHFWECGDRELRFPFHVGENRSRTWVFIRHDDRLELRHDHRHRDGTEEENTWYGASTMAEGTANRQEFVRDRDGVLMGWRVEIEPGRHYSYGTIRDGEWRHHLEFDLTRPVPAPLLPWGSDKRPSQKP
jgi:hypothetical protein